MAFTKTRRKAEPAGMIAELAYWDERHNGVRVPFVLETNQVAVSCVITRWAAQALAASAPPLTPRECFGVAHRHMREVASIARKKVAARNGGRHGAVLIERADVVAARQGARHADLGNART